MLLLRLLGAELRWEWGRARAYKLEYVSDLLLFGLGFLLLSGLFDIVAGGEYSPTQRGVALLGYLTWRVADGAMLGTVNRTANDSGWGTLEQIWLGPVAPQWIFATRSVTLFVTVLLRALLVALVILPFVDVKLAWPPVLLPIFLLTQLGAFGVAYALVGFHLVSKSVASLTLAISTSLLFLTGALAPLEGAAGLQSVALLLPLGPGMQMMRTAVLEGASALTALDFVWLGVHTGIYVGVGLLVFRWGQRRARVLGQLAHY